MALDLKFRMLADADPAVREMRRMRGEVEKQTSGIKSAFKGLAALGVGAAAVSFFKSSVDEAIEAQKVSAQTAAVIKSTGAAAGVTQTQIEDLAGAISAKAAIDDEAIQAGENMLLTFTNIRNEVGRGNDVFNQATSILVDMSVAMGKDMKSSAIGLGKALNDPVKGVTALSRVGVQFTDQQKEQIATLTESGNRLEAQKIILAELSKEFAGSAEAQATGADRFKVALANLEEEVGTALMPALEDLAGFLTDDVIPAVSSVIHFIEDNKTQIKILTGVVLGGYAAWKTWRILTSVAAWLTTARVRYAQYVATLSYGNKLQRAQSVVLQQGIGRLAGYTAGVAAAGTALYYGGKALSNWVEGSNDATVTALHLTDAIASFRDELVATNGAIDDSVRLDVAKQLQDKGLAERAEAAGISLRELTAAVVGSDEALDDLIERWEASGDPSQETIDNVRTMALAFHQAQRVAGDLGTVTDENSGAQKNLAGAMTDTTDKAKDQRSAIDKLTDAFDRFNRRTLDAAEADLSYRDSLTELRKAFKGNNDTLDRNTAKGREHLRSIFASIKAAQEDAKATLERTKSSEKARRAFELDRAEIRQHLVALGLDRDKVRELLKTYAQTPKFKTTKFEADTSTAETQVQDFIRRVETTHGTITFNARAAIGTSGFASGTNYAPAGWHWVGENGPELMKFRGGERVLSHPESVRYQSAESNKARTVPGPLRFILDASSLGQLTGFVDARSAMSVLSHNDHDNVLLGMD